MAHSLQGILPAIASPCDENDRFLDEAFDVLADWLFAQGVDGLYVCGGTGDGYNMHLNERKRAVEIAVQAARKHTGKVIAHVGTLNTRDAVELAEHAAGAGADAVSSIPPVNRSHAELISYYRDIATAAKLPLLVYHIPKLSGHLPTADEMVELLDIDGVIGFKFADWNLFFMKQVLLRRPNSVVFSGNDEILLPGLMYGASGGIGMNYNLFPRLFMDIHQTVATGDIERAAHLQHLYLVYADVLWKYGGVKPNFETLMRDRFGIPYCFRRPRDGRDQKTDQAFLAEMEPRLEAIDEATSI